MLFQMMQWYRGGSATIGTYEIIIMAILIILLVLLLLMQMKMNERINKIEDELGEIKSVVEDIKKKFEEI